MTVDRWLLIASFYSPEGIFSGEPVLTGSPKFGVPSAFQVNFCIREFLELPHPCPVEEFAW